jgi:hypothetical protein
MIKASAPGAERGDAPFAISISVPESWWEFDIRPEGREATVRALVDDRVRHTPELAPYRADVTSMLRKMAKDAHDSGALYMGCMAENFDGIPLSATVTVSVLGAKNKQGVALSTDPQDKRGGKGSKGGKGDGGGK